MKATSKEIALQIKATCKELGWTYQVRNGTILEIRKSIESNDDAFVRADSEYYSILGLVPTTSAGSIWGTTGDTVGALSAMSSGVFVMKKSGCSIRVLNALNKLDAVK